MRAGFRAGLVARILSDVASGVHPLGEVNIRGRIAVSACDHAANVVSSGSVR